MSATSPDLTGDHPAREDLLHLATAHLRGKVAPGLDAEARYNLLLAARAVEIAWRDRELAAARTQAVLGVERAANSNEAAAAIRAGICDGDADLHGALRAATAIAAFPTRPDVLTGSEREAVEALRAGQGTSGAAHSTK